MRRSVVSRVRQWQVAALIVSATAAGADAQVALQDTFGYSSSAQLTAAGWSNAFGQAAGVGSTFELLPSVPGWISSNASQRPASIPGQSLARLTESGAQRAIGGTLTGDWELSANLLMSGYAGTAQVAVLDSAGHGYVFAWRGGTPSQSGGNGLVELHRADRFTSATADEDGPMLGSAVSGAMPPTGYPLPASASNPLMYAVDDPFLGYSNLRLTWSEATSTLRGYQDGTLRVEVSDATYGGLSSVGMSGGGATTYVDNITLLGTVVVPETSGAGLVFGVGLGSVLLRRRRRVAGQSGGHPGGRECVEALEERRLLSAAAMMAMRAPVVGVPVRVMGPLLAAVATQMPEPWAVANIGTPEGTPSASWSAGTFSLSAAGETGDTADRFQFVYQRLSGDGYISTRIGNIAGGGAAAAGVMVRESLAPGSKFAQMSLGQAGDASFEYRLNTSYVSYEQPLSAEDAGAWIKLVRNGNTISAFRSADGVTWTTAGSESIPMQADVYVGLVVASGGAVSAGSSTFSDVAVPQNIVNYGASPALSDNTPAIAHAIKAAANNGNVIYVPPGQFRHTSMIELGGAQKLMGAGAFGVNPRNAGEVSELRSTNGDAASVHLTGSGAELSNLRISSNYAANRLQSDRSTGIYADGAANFTIRRVEVSGGASGGMMITHGAHDGLVTLNRVHGTLADGIHTTNGSYRITVSTNEVWDTGDDLIATVGYDGKIDPATGLNWPQPTDITIRDNNVWNTGRDHGRGIAVVGARNVLVDNNTITDAPNSGIIIVSEDAYDSLAVDNITVTRNRIINPNTQNLSGTGGNHGGVYIGGRNGFPVTGVTIGSATDPALGNTISNAMGQGVNVSLYSSNIAVYNNLIDKVTGYGVRVNTARNVAIGGNTIRETGRYGIYFHGANTGTASITNNVLSNINSSNTSSFDAIQISTGSSFGSLTITGNDYTNPARYAVNRFIECHFATAVVTGNTTNTGKPIYVGP